jgi:3-hydroxyacyl-CoA dehydrogenase
MFVFKVGVVGAGIMGGEIAQSIAAADIPVVLTDIEPERVQAGLRAARSSWQRLVDAGTLAPEERDRGLALITGATGYDAFGDVDLVIEAVPERVELKLEVFAELDEVTPSHAILASNTSALSITELGEATGRADKVVGLHFFYPASINRVVEVIEGDDTSVETLQAAISFAQAIRKTVIRCGDAPGFVVNRILTASVSELWRYQEQTGVAIDAIDRAVVASGAAPVGPFRLADLLGLDTVLHVARHMQRSYGQRFAVHEQMSRLVEQGRLGVKTGGGFYEHGA